MKRRDTTLHCLVLAAGAVLCSTALFALALVPAGANPGAEIALLSAAVIGGVAALVAALDALG